MPSFEQIDVSGAKEMIDKKQATVVDIRDPQSYSESRIQGAVNINDENIQDFLKNTDKNKPLICYCYRGFSSQGAAEYFSEQGFAKTYSLTGGFEEWRQQYPGDPSR